jgi:hypothetical protein
MRVAAAAMAATTPGESNSTICGPLVAPAVRGSGSAA